MGEQFANESRGRDGNDQGADQSHQRYHPIYQNISKYSCWYSHPLYVIVLASIVHVWILGVQFIEVLAYLESHFPSPFFQQATTTRQLRQKQEKYCTFTPPPPSFALIITHLGGPQAQGSSTNKSGKERTEYLYPLLPHSPALYAPDILKRRKRKYPTYPPPAPSPSQVLANHTADIFESLHGIVSVLMGEV